MELIKTYYLFIKIDIEMILKWNADAEIMDKPSASLIRRGTLVTKLNVKLCNMYEASSSTAGICNNLWIYVLLIF